MRINQYVSNLEAKTARLDRARADMQADLNRQRDDMREALDMLEAGQIREAMVILGDGLAYRERTREPRKAANIGNPVTKNAASD